jgi:hypothetical protein
LNGGQKVEMEDRMKKAIIFWAVVLTAAGGLGPVWAQVSAKPDTQAMIEKIKQKHLHKNKHRTKKISGTVRKPSTLPTPAK